MQIGTAQVFLDVLDTALGANTSTIKKEDIGTNLKEGTKERDLR